jgi:predicted lipoprotein with Yx(FWY)xxD motif
MRRMLLVQAIVIGLVAALCAGAAFAVAGTTSSEKGGSVVISTRKVGKFGTILVDAKGRTLYMFVPDKDKRVTCVKTCAAIWPPIFLPAGSKVVAKGQVKQKLLGSDRDPAGGRVVTYAGWPLYLYVGDTKPGMATGQALNLNGGLWYVLAPSGKVIKAK